MKTKHLVLIVLLGTNLGTYSQSAELDNWFAKGYEHLYTSKDSASYYFNKIYESSLKDKDLTTAFDALSLLNYVYGYHYDLTKYGRTLRITDSIVLLNPSFLDKNPSYIPYIYLDKANYNYKLRDFESSRVFLDSLVIHIGKLNRILSSDEDDLLDRAYSFYAAMYAEEGKFDLARDYYLRNLRKYQTIKETDSLFPQVLATNNLIANLYSKEGDPKTSNRYFLKSLRYYLKEKNERYKNNLITTSFNVVRNYLKLNNIDSARHYMAEAKLFLPKDDPFWPNYWRLEGDVLKSIDSSKARTSYDNAVELFKTKPNRFRIKEVSETLGNISELYQYYGDYENALYFSNQAIAYLKSENSDGIGMKATDEVSDKSLYLKIMGNKAEILFSLKNFKGVSELMDSYMIALDELRLSFESNIDKKNLLEQSYPVFEIGLAALLEQFNQTHNDDYISKAFTIFEKTKGLRLLEGLYRANARAYGDIPPSLLEREKQLRSELLFLDKQLKDKQNTINENNVFKAKEDYRTLIEQIERDYPKYYNLTYNNDNISLNEVISSMKKQEAIATYFYGNKAVYSIGIEKDRQTFNKISLDSKFTASITSYSTMLNDPNSSIKELNRLGTYFYSELLNPLGFKKQISDMIVVPDGLLNYLPFESFRNNDNYILNDNSIRYTTSLTFLNQLRTHTTANNLMSYAPSFNDRYSHLPPLPHNEKEAKIVNSHFPGESSIGSEATLSHFFNTADQYSMLHFATHAIIDDQNPDYSYLSFVPSTNDNSNLYVADLYNMTLNTKLVTLSACHSGDGRLERGEGFISLSRGFFYAGASSIVHTLWNVNDASSAVLMDDFYNYLEEGQDKSNALRLSKLDFIKQNHDNKLSHPYYWSGYLLNGNGDAIVSKRSTIFIGFIVILVLLGISLFSVVTIEKN